jgi:hypothetical protein
LITFGAIVLCIGSPLTAWLTSRIERRTLFAATLAVLALTNAASAFAPDYASLLIIRLVMLAVGALYTPQAAGTGALIVPLERRGSTIAYIFLGWSLAAAVGLPLIAFVASRYGFRAVYGGIGLIGLLSFCLVAWRLPSGLLGAPVELKTWAELGRNRLIIVLLAITTMQMSGQFVVFTFMGPLLAKLTGAGADSIGLVFALYGVCGFVGVLIATRIVDSWGAWRTSVLFTVLMLTGVIGAERRDLQPDGHLGRDLGIGLCVDQLDAAGPAGRRRAAARVRFRRAQYLGALYRPGRGLGDRRRAVRARLAAWRWLRVGGLRCASTRGGDPDPPARCKDVLIADARHQHSQIGGANVPATGLRRRARLRSASATALPPF